MSTTEPRPFQRAVRKIKCAAMVNSLAKSWQGWAQEHSASQDTIPSGWMPSSITQDLEDKQRAEVKLTMTPRVVQADGEDGGSKIRTGSVTKTVVPKRSECAGGGGDLVTSLKEKIQQGPDEGKSFLGNESPTRRRQMRALSGTLQDRKSMLSDRKLGSRSSSLDTEDSGLGEEVGLSENGDPRSEQSSDGLGKKPVNRPKVKISTMGDIKSRWQQWSNQHMEGQKLNPFSEEFDFDLAMAQRLQKGDDGYGRPKEGSKTAARGDRAQKHVHKEMEEMCWIIRDMDYKDKEGRTVVTFGRLFDRYVKISDKVVGILLRCRKHKMLDFEGEMLWKGQDDHVIITLRD
ncbi:actin-binding Rho-activating protein [Aplochiton taeniatus]